MNNHKDIFKSISESLQNVYEETERFMALFFIQGEEADEFISYFDEHGADETIDWMFDQGYLTGEEQNSSVERPWGARDSVYYTKDGKYVIGINYNIPYFSVTELVD